MTVAQRPQPRALTVSASAEARRWLTSPISVAWIRGDGRHIARIILDVQSACNLAESRSEHARNSGAAGRSPVVRDRRIGRHAVQLSLRIA